MAEQDDVQELILADFTGGLNTTLDQTLIKDSEFKVATNVFYDLHGAPQKRYGYSALASNPSSAFQGNVRMFYTGGLLLTGVADPAFSSAEYSAWIWNGASWSFARYGSSSTATFTNGSANVDRSTGTAEWTTQVGAGDRVTADGGTTWYTVQSVTNDSRFVLTTTFAESTTTVALAVAQQLKTTPAQVAVAFGGYAVVGPMTDPSSGTSGLMSIQITNSGAGLLSTNSRRITSAPALNLMASHKNYLFGVNNVGSVPSRLFWSAVTDPTSFPASNFVDVSPNDGGIIRGLVSYNDVLYIFKDNDIFYLTGEVFDPANPTFSLRKIVNPHRVGCIQPRSIRVYEGRIIFVGPDDMYAIESGTNIVPFGKAKIRTEILTTGFFTSNDYWHAEIFDNKYWLSYSDGTLANNMQLVLDKNGSWSKHTLPMFTMATDLSKRWLYFWDYNSLASNQIDMLGLLTNDNGAAITTTLESRVFGFGDFTRTSHVVDLYVAFKNAANQAATVKTYDNNGLVTTTSVSFPGGSTQAFAVTRIPVERDTNGFYFQISDATVSSSFTLLAALITYTKDARGSGNVVT